MCWELVAACGPQAAVPGAGRHPSHGASWHRERGGSTPTFLPPSRRGVKKAPGAGGLRVPCQLDKPQRWIWQLGQGQRGLPWVPDRSERGIKTGCPSGRHGRRQPHAATCSEPALPSVWLSALSAAAPKAEGKEESRERKPN